MKLWNVCCDKICLLCTTVNGANKMCHKYGYHMSHMGWLRFVGSSKVQVFFAKEPYKRDDILQKRPIILRSLLIVATLYVQDQRGYQPCVTINNANRLCHTYVCGDTSCLVCVAMGWLRLVGSLKL